MAVTLKIPTCLTFSDLRKGITEQAITAINSFLTSIGQQNLPTDPEQVVGLPNPFVLSLNDFDMGGAAFLRTNAMDGLATCGPIDNFTHMPLGYVSLIVAVGGDIEGLPVWFVIDNPTEACPFAPDDLVDEEGNPLPQETWETYGTLSNGSYVPKQIGDSGPYYRPNNFGYDGTMLKASEWVPLVLTGAIQQPLSKADYADLVAANAPEV
jgi:hypothetical protein